MELLVLLVINLSLQWSLGQNNCRIVGCQQYVRNEFTKRPTNALFGYLHFSEERYYEIDIVNCAHGERSFVPKFCKIVWCTRFYRPQIKFAKVMFSQVSVHSGGVSVSGPWGYLLHLLGRHPMDTPSRQTPPRQTPPLGRHPSGKTNGQTPPGRHPPPGSACWNTVNKRAVHIPLECILVKLFANKSELSVLPERL